MKTFCHKRIFLLVSALFLVVSTISGANNSASYATHIDKAGTSLFTGRMSYSIPIYTIEDPDFHLDIALRYSSEGFKPFQPSGCYGQDWSLVAGGCITRSVQGFPDDQYYGIALRDSLVGMSRAIQDGNVPNKEAVFQMEDSIYDSDCGVVYHPGYWQRCMHKVDYVPDIFCFNFCGYKGRFIINNKGDAVIISGDYVSINLSHMKDNNIPPVTTDYAFSNAPYIEIQTTDGYKFVFGGFVSALEYSVMTKRGGKVGDQLPPAITAWHLTKIIAPNDRRLTLSYTHGTSQISYHITDLQSFITDYDCSEPKTDTIHITYSLYKECLLQSITTSDSLPLTVSFKSNTEAQKMYNHDDFSYCVPHGKLDSIIVSYNGDTLRTANLSYIYRSHDLMFNAHPNYYWRYLSEVTISGVGKYQMAYNDLDFNIGNAIHPVYVRIYPDLYPKTDSEYKNMVDRMGFWKETPLQGMLNEVTLPTGGKLRFTYSNHQYGEERRFRVVGTKDVELYSLSAANQSIGGARIEKIETFSDDSTLVETKTFSYNKQGTNASSGIFYNIYEIFYPNNPNEGLSIANPFNYGLIHSHIGYSYVEQQTTVGTDSCKNAYTFDTGRNFYSSLNSSLINHNDTIAGYNDTTELRSGSLTYDGWLISPGKLLKAEQYRGNVLAKSIHYKYNGLSDTSFGTQAFGPNSLRCTDTIVCLSKYSAHVARKLFVCPDVLEQVTTKEYSQEGQVMESAKNYTYDSIFRLKCVTTTDSRGITHFTKYTYPDELCTSYPDSYHLLVNANRIGHPIEVYSGFIKNDAEYITEGTVEHYANNAYSLHGQQHFKPYLRLTSSLALSEPITDYQPMSTQNGHVTCDERYTTVTEYRFDLMNRPTLVKPYGQIATTYTWDGLYPVTKTIGNQTWTYTYKPYVGVTSVTDLRGITTYYTYDAVGRLVEVYQVINGKKEILNAYQYHLKTE